MNVNGTSQTGQMQQMQMRKMDGSGGGHGQGGGGMKDVMQNLSSDDQTALKDQMSSLSQSDRKSAMEQMKQIDPTSTDYSTEISDIMSQYTEPTTTSSDVLAATGSTFSTYA